MLCREWKFYGRKTASYRQVGSFEGDRDALKGVAESSQPRNQIGSSEAGWESEEHTRGVTLRLNRLHAEPFTDAL